MFDPEAPVAAELYAFSTTALEPATGTDAGLLAGEKTLQPALRRSRASRCSTRTGSPWTP